MTSPAIAVENLGKRYVIRHQGRNGSMREALARGARNLLRAAAFRPSLDGSGREDFWALREVGFEIGQGEVTGIIGRNGAGKSTLLKILSRITEPTEGRVVIDGRVASLLEVGTGFHPELTGRENIFLNGAILGMSRVEIRSKFDQIVAFAEVEKFLDTPVKRYSSGMYVRLAFAVAAHLEPEILVVDEVLAVGDASFQKKCLGRMQDVSKEGRTVLFVSHNMDAVKRLCSRAVWLEQGKVRRIGDTNDCVSKYLLAGVQEGGRIDFDPPRAFANGLPASIRAVQTGGPDGVPRQVFSRAEPIHVTLEWESFEPVYKPRTGFVLQTSDGADVFTAFDATSWSLPELPPGRWRSSCVIPADLMNEGEYVLDFGADAPRRRDDRFPYDFTQSRTGAILRIEIEDDMTLPNKYYGEEGFRDARWPGVVLPRVDWTREAVEIHPQISRI